MVKEHISWYSERLQRDMSIRIYGDKGTPVLVFPTQDAMSDNFENFGMIDTLSGYLNEGRIQLFCVDTVDTETWSNVWGDKGWRANRQEAYYNYIVAEVLPFIADRTAVWAACMQQSYSCDVRNFLRGYCPCRAFTMPSFSLMAG